MDTFDEVKVCVAYEIDGVLTRSMPYHQSDLHRAVPIYETFPGWKTDLTKVTQAHQLPSKARSYLDFLAAEIGVPIGVVGTGPGRDQYVQLG
jgi:adenylosuccinate synthase